MVASSRSIGAGRTGRRGQVFQRQHVFGEPCAVGLSGGQLLLELLVPDDSAFLEAHQEHAAGLKAALEPYILGWDLQDAGFRRHHQLVFIGYQIAKRPQAVSVQQGAEAAAVGRHDHCRTVPWLHQRRMVFVEVLLLLRHGLMLVPSLGDHHEHGVVQVTARH